MSIILLDLLKVAATAVVKAVAEYLSATKPTGHRQEFIPIFSPRFLEPSALMHRGDYLNTRWTAIYHKGC